MRTPLKSPTRLVIAILTFALWLAALYLAHLSGRAMDDTVGTTIESQDLQALSGVFGFLAAPMSVALLVAEQSGGTVVRFVKVGVTFFAVLSVYVIASFVLKTVSSP